MPPVALPPNDGRPSTPPPKRAEMRPGEDNNAARRGWEKAMYEWMTAHGTSCAPAEKCGPCDRMGTECVRFPDIVVKKCALCFRGHDVCEMWDETVVSHGRRRISAKPATPKKVIPVGGKQNSTLTNDEWAVNFQKTIKALIEKKAKDEEEQNKRSKRILFRKKSVPVDKPEKADGVSNPRKRKRNEMVLAFDVKGDKMRTILKKIPVKSQPAHSTDIYQASTQTESNGVPTVDRQAPPADALRQIPPLDSLTPIPTTLLASSENGNLPSQDCQAITVHIPQQDPPLNHLAPIPQMLPVPVENNNPPTNDRPDVPIESPQQDVPRSSLAPIPPVPALFKNHNLPSPDGQVGPVSIPYDVAPGTSPPSAPRDLLPRPPSAFLPYDPISRVKPKAINLSSHLTPVVKKPRGRPRKSQELAPKKSDASSLPIPEPVLVPLPDTLKSQAVFRPNEPTPPLIPNTTGLFSSPTTPLKRPRGRPRKSLDPVPNQSVTPTTSYTLPEPTLAPQPDLFNSIPSALPPIEPPSDSTPSSRPLDRPPSTEFLTAAQQRISRLLRIHDRGTVETTPCLRCFRTRRQCVRTGGQKSCTYCRLARCRCEGDVELGRWVEVNGAVVWEDSTDEAVARYRADISLSEKLPLKIGLKFGGHASTIETEITPQHDIPDEDRVKAGIANPHLEFPGEQSNEQQFPVAEGMQETTADNISTYMSLDYIMHTMDESTPQNENLHGEIPLDPLLFQAWIYDEYK